MEKQFWSFEQLKAPEKIQLSNKEIVNLSDTQFKTLVIRVLQEFTGYFNNIKKTQAAMKVALCEIKKILPWLVWLSG